MSYCRFCMIFNKDYCTSPDTYCERVKILYTYAVQYLIVLQTVCCIMGLPTDNIAHRRSICSNTSITVQLCQCAVRCSWGIAQYMLLSLRLETPLYFLVCLTAMASDEDSGGPKAQSATYTEDLTIQRLGGNHVAARFVFRSSWRPKDRHRCQSHEHWPDESSSRVSGWPGDMLCHFEVVFPRSVGVLLDRFKVRELRLQMSKGLWDFRSWGNGPAGGASGEYTPGGAELWARLPADDAWESWVGLRRSLSGLYCTSLDALDDAKVHEPKEMSMPMETPGTRDAFLDEAHSGDRGWWNTTVLRGTLPREPVCTENLIPLIKMLPCRSKNGLGRLLHPMRLFQADYYSVSARATASFSSPSEAAEANIPGPREFVESLTLEQTVLAVFRPRPRLPSPIPDSRRGSNSGSENPAEAPPTSVHDWSILSLLLPPKLAEEWASSAGKGEVLEACPVATRSAIHVLSPAEQAESEFSNGGEVSSVAEGTSELKEACEVSSEVEDQVCGDGTRIALAGCSDSSGLDPKLVITSHNLLSSADRRGGEGDALPVGTVNDFLQAKLYGPTGMGRHGQVFDLEIDHAASTPRNPNATDSITSGADTISSTQGLALLDHFLAGRGGTRGVSVAHLVNLHPTAAANVEFLQAVPYFMVPLLGTLRARLIPNHKKGSPIGVTPEVTEVTKLTPFADGEALNASSVGEVSPFHVLDLRENVTLTPGEGKRSTVLELRLWVPPGTTLVFGFDFLKRFLTVDDFPPDPSRGFDVPPPLARFEFVERASQKEEVCEVGRLVTAPFGEDGKDMPHLACGTVDPSGRGSVLGARSTVGRRVLYAYGEAGLMDTPQPDFSMPFNVITFTSTVITFFLGTAINLLVRKRANRHKKGGNGEEAPRGLLARAWQKWRKRKRGAEL